MAAAFLIVSVPQCKGVISGWVKQPQGGCSKERQHVTTLLHIWIKIVRCFDEGWRSRVSLGQ